MVDVTSTGTGHADGSGRVAAMSALVGNTPMLEIRYRWDGHPRRIYAKYEAMNMTGSIKDRMAIHMIHCGYESGRLHPGDTIVEASSGNTGISFSGVGRALGHPVRIYIPDWMSQERIQLIRTFGAEVILVTSEEGGFLGALDRAEAYAAGHDHVFLPRQFAHASNLEAHMNSTGPEIESQLERFGHTPDAFVAGVGTGGTVMGVGRFLRRDNRSVHIHPLEPANSPTLRIGHKVGKHRIQGISDDFIPPIVDLSALDNIIDVWDGDAILMAQALCRTIGLAVGISSGANVVGAMQLVEQLGPDATVVTVLPDSNKKYLSTDLCHDEPARDDYLTPHIDLDYFNAIR